MAADGSASRDDLARQAERHLRLGRTDLAIELYERLAGLAPTDWNCVKQLADLLERSGRRDAAAARFLECADHYFQEGFHAKAAALYRKVLKLEPQSEHAWCQLADVSLALKLKVDARQALAQVLMLRHRRGDSQGAQEISARLADLEPDDARGRGAAQVGPVASTATSTPAEAAPVPEPTAEPTPAAPNPPPVPPPSPEEVSERLRGLARDIEARGDTEGAFRAWQAVLDRHPDDVTLRRQLVRTALDLGDLGVVTALLEPLTLETFIDLALHFEVAQRQSRPDRSREVVARAALRYEAATEAVLGVRERLREQDHTLADLWVALSVDALVQSKRIVSAVSLLEAANQAHVLPLECHLRWVELCIDARLDGLDRAQQALVSSYLRAGQPALARSVVDDLLLRRPDLESVHALVAEVRAACGDAEPEERLEALLDPVDALEPSAPAVEAWPADDEVASSEPPDDQLADPPAAGMPLPVEPHAPWLAPAAQSGVPLEQWLGGDVTPVVATPAAAPAPVADCGFDWGALLGRDLPAPPTEETGAPESTTSWTTPDEDAPRAPEDVEVETPAIAETPVVDEAPVEVETPVVGEAPVEVDTPVAVEAPPAVPPAPLSVTCHAPAPPVSPTDEDEVDLTELLEELQPRPVVPAPAPTPDPPPPTEPVDVVATDVADAVSAEPGEDDAPAMETDGRLLAAQQVAAGRVFAAAGLVSEAARAFERASGDLRCRFEAAEALADLHRSRGQLTEAAHWYEQAAGAPVADATIRRPVLYDLAETLEAVGQPDRALAVLLDLLSEVEDYRDARVRADRLLRVTAGG